MFVVENFSKGFKQELKEAHKEGIQKGMQKGIQKGLKKGIFEGKKETFFDGIFALLTNKFGNFNDNIKQKILALNPTYFNLIPYVNTIFCSENAEDAYNRIVTLNNIDASTIFMKTFIRGLKEELKEKRKKGIQKGIKQGIKLGIKQGIIEGKKETFFDGIFALLTNKFSDFNDNIKQKILALNPKSFDLTPYVNTIFCAKSAEDACNKIAKLAAL